MRMGSKEFAGYYTSALSKLREGDAASRSVTLTAPEAHALHFGIATLARRSKAVQNGNQTNDHVLPGS